MNPASSISAFARLLALSAGALLALGAHAQAQTDPLPSWNDGAAKQAIVDFVAKVTKEGSPDFVPPAERIATFDNDGTLWAEQPMYFQFALCARPGEGAGAAASGVEGQGAVRLAAQRRRERRLAGRREGDGGDHHGHARRHDHRGIREDRYGLDRDARSIRKFKRPYTECVYQPMVELLAYLRANGFKTFIVSGGGIEFMRPGRRRSTAFRPSRSSAAAIKTKFEMRDGKPVLVRLPEIDFIDDKAGKPVGINKFIGRRPIAAFGNSDGDLQMLEWTQARRRRALLLIVHHDDAEREFAYGARSNIGTFCDALMAEAKEKGWTVVSMKNDWKQIFAFEK